MVIEDRHQVLDALRERLRELKADLTTKDEQVTLLIHRAIQARGYLVICPRKPYKEQLPVRRDGVWCESTNTHKEHPFTVFSETTFEDYAEQCLLLGIPHPAGKRYYYRVITD